PSAELDDEIRSLGTRYGIPTELTAYLVLEPGMESLAERPVEALQQRVQGNESMIGRAATVPERSIPAASPASSAAKSEREFQLAREAAAQRSAVSVADADEASESGAGELRRVAGYTLSRRPDGTRVDVNSTPALPRVHVRAYSAAWFEIVNLLPELAPV